MNSASSFIALRYLFSKKKHNAINIVSGVSAFAVAVVVAAMICVMSVMNGFERVIEQMFSLFDADLRIESKEGKSFVYDTEEFNKVRQLSYIDVFAPCIEETALVEHSDKQLAARLKGVGQDYARLTKIDSIIIDGSYMVDDGAFYRAVLGQGLAAQLGIGAHFVRGMHIYAPKRHKRVNLMRPDESFERATCYISGIFAVNQPKYDDEMMLVSIDMTRHLYDYDDNEATAVEIKLNDNISPAKAKKEIIALLGNGYNVCDRYEQQADFFRIVKIEKLLTALLLTFILLIASFNLIGSLTMLIIDKKEDVKTLTHLGADHNFIRRLFRTEGWLISVSGAVIGVIIGLALCLTQEHYGWLRLGNGANYVLSAYPVDVQITDVIVVVLTVVLIGWLAAWLPTRNMKIDEI